MLTRRTAEAFLAWARAGSHRVSSVGIGPWPGPEDYPLHQPTAGPDARLAPNEVLDAARQAAHAQTLWVHAVLPTLADAVALAVAVLPADPASVRPCTGGGAAQTADRDRPGWLRLVRRATGPGTGGDPRREPFAQLVAAMPLTVRTLTAVQNGQAVHITEIPAAWLDQLTADPAPTPTTR